MQRPYEALHNDLITAISTNHNKVADHVDQLTKSYVSFIADLENQLAAEREARHYLEKLVSQVGEVVLHVKDMPKPGVTGPEVGPAT